MSKIVIHFTILLCAIMASVPVAAGDSVSVVTTLAMLADLTTVIGGPYVTVTHLVPGLGSPHSFEPTIKHLKLFQDADIFVQVGLGLEPWSNQLIKSADSRMLSIVSVGQSPADNPHIWLDEPHLEMAVTRLQAALAQAMPQHKEYFAAQAETFTGRVHAVFAKYRPAFSDRGFFVVTTVPTYSYLLADLSIRELGPLEKGHGDPPSARQVADLVQQAKAAKAVCVVSEKGLDHGFGEILAQETGLPLVSLSPLPGPQEDLLGFLERNLSALLKAVDGAVGND